jgi:hypothetical protein
MVSCSENDYELSFIKCSELLRCLKRGLLCRVSSGVVLSDMGCVRIKQCIICSLMQFKKSVKLAHIL